MTLILPHVVVEPRLALCRPTWRTMAPWTQQRWWHAHCGLAATTAPCRGCCSRRDTRPASLLAFLAVAACAALPRAGAHGWIAVPAARNLVHVGQQGFWQQMSLNRCGRNTAVQVLVVSQG